MTPQYDSCALKGIGAFITRQTGIVVFEHQLNAFEAAIDRVCHQFGYPTPAVLLDAIQIKPGLSPELEVLLEKLTVGESYFFRDPAQMALLRDTLLPELISKKRQNHDLSLRIWSAGCSIGQEIYSLAIILDELLPDREAWQLHLLATDINTHALVELRRACFKEWSFRAMPPLMLDRYFTPLGSEYVLNDAIRQCVISGYLNLSENVFPSTVTQTEAMDLILCRNVLIYIESKMVQLIVQRFVDCLVPDGILILGPSDFMNSNLTTLNRVTSHDTAYYQKSALKTPVSLPISAPHQSKVKVSLPRPAPVRMKPNVSNQGDLHERLVKLLREGRWQEVLLVSQQGLKDVAEPLFFLQARFKALVNLGRFGEASKAAEYILTRYPLDKVTYLIKGMMLMEQAHFLESEVAFRRAIYLDHRFPEAYYQLALLLLKTDRQEAALKHFETTLKLAAEADPNQTLESAHEMIMGDFVAVLNKERAIYSQSGLITKGARDDRTR